MDHIYSHVDDAYFDLVNLVLRYGSRRANRTGVESISYFAANIKLDLQKGFPLLTTKQIHFKSVVEELFWFLRGETNVRSLQSRGVSIWDEWADENGYLGRIYGYQWRKWEAARWDKDASGFNVAHIDQIEEVIRALKSDRYSRRHVVSAWNVGDIFREEEDYRKPALPPCHMLFQFHVGEGTLNCSMVMRSADVGLGVPFNMASYALLTQMIAQEVGLEPGLLHILMNDCHIYVNHLDGLAEQLTRDKFDMPTVAITRKQFELLGSEDVNLVGYKHHPRIKLDIAK